MDKISLNDVKSFLKGDKISVAYLNKDGEIRSENTQRAII